MVHPVEELAAKAGDLSPSFRLHMVGGESRVSLEAL